MLNILHYFGEIGRERGNSIKAYPRVKLPKYAYTLIMETFIISTGLIELNGNFQERREIVARVIPERRENLRK